MAIAFPIALLLHAAKKANVDFPYPIESCFTHYSQGQLI